MADQKDIGLKINIDSSGAKKTIGELRKEFADLQAEINNSVQGSEKFNNAIFRLGEVKGEIKDVKEQMMALDPEERARAFSGLAQTIVGGFVAAKGAAALFGAENENIEKAILKVQGATALLQGFQSFADGQKQLNIIKIIALNKIELVQKNLALAAESRSVVVRNLATAAQWLLNAAMAANPIGAVVVALVALTGAMIYFSNRTKDTTKSIEQLNSELEFNKKINESVEQGLKNTAEVREGGILDLEKEIKIMKLRGATDEELAKTEMKLANMRSDLISDRREQYDDDLKAFKANELLINAEEEKANGKISEALQKKIDFNDAQSLELKKRNEALLKEEKENSINRELLEAEHLANILKLKNESDKKAEEKRKQEAEKLKAQTEEDRLAALELNRKLDAEILADEFEKKKKQRETEEVEQQEKIKKLLISEEEKKVLLRKSENDFALDMIALKKENDLKIKEEDDKKKKEAFEKRTEELNNEIEILTLEHQSTLEKKLELLEIEHSQKEMSDREFYLKGKELRDADAQEQLDTAQKISDAKHNIAKSSLDGLSSLSTLFVSNSKKLEGFQKGIALTQIAVDTASGISSAIRDGMKVGITPIEKAVVIAGGIALVLGNMAKAKSLLSGSGSTATPSLSTSAGTGGVLQSQAGQVGQPTQNTFVNPASTLLQVGGNGSGQRQGRDTQDIRVFVTETDITNTQDKVDRINRRATLQ